MYGEMACVGDRIGGFGVAGGSSWEGGGVLGDCSTLLREGDHLVWWR